MNNINNELNRIAGVTKPRATNSYRSIGEIIYKNYTEKVFLIEELANEVIAHLKTDKNVIAFRVLRGSDVIHSYNLSKGTLDSYKDPMYERSLQTIWHNQCREFKTEKRTNSELSDQLERCYEDIRKEFRY